MVLGQPPQREQTENDLVGSDGREECDQSRSHLRDVPSLVEVCCLKQFRVRNTVFPSGSQEGLYVLHQHEGGSLRIRKIGMVLVPRTI